MSGPLTQQPRQPHPFFFEKQTGEAAPYIHLEKVPQPTSHALTTVQTAVSQPSGNP